MTFRNTPFLPYKQVSIAPLVIFRIIFGALMLFGTLRFMSYGWVKDLYITPKFFFGFYGFEWVKPLPDYWMYLPFIVMLITSTGILLGAFYRVSALLFFLAFTYVELLDKTNYLNHYYFVSLVALLMIFVPAHHNFSIDVKRRPKLSQELVSQWTIRILQFQLACVYFFAGLAKLNYDWLLDAQPLKLWLQAHRDMPIFGDILAKEWVAYAFSWFGCIYDLIIVALLLSNKWRKVGYFLVIAFHFITWYLFPIGVFPWVMIFSTLIFFSSEFHLKLLAILQKLVSWKAVDSSKVQLLPRKSRILTFFIVLFVLIQLMVPFRYLLYPKDLFWHEEGFRFSWRVMLMHKEGYSTFYLKDRATGKTMEVKNEEYLTPRQIDHLNTQPDMILQYAHHLKIIYDDTILHFGNKSIHLKNPSVHARIFATLNERPSQLFISEKYDLTQFKYNLCHRTWIEPLKQ